MKRASVLCLVLVLGLAVASPMLAVGLAQNASGHTDLATVAESVSVANTIDAVPTATWVYKDALEAPAFVSNNEQQRWSGWTTMPNASGVTNCATSLVGIATGNTFYTGFVDEVLCNKGAVPVHTVFDYSTSGGDFVPIVVRYGAALIPTTGEFASKELSSASSGFTTATVAFTGNLNPAALHTAPSG